MEEKRIEKTSLNIAIIPPKDILEEAIEMSEMISRQIKSEFILASERLIPHITVYQAEYPKSNADSVKDVVRKLSARRSFEIFLDEISIFYDTFIFWRCKVSEDLLELQRKAVMLANPLREGIVSLQLKNVEELSKDDRYDVENFGSLLIGPRYIPHITVTRTERGNDEKRIHKILGISKKRSFVASSLALGSLGPHGTVTDTIECFSFK
jgi:2'-5' RNA ligase